MELRQLRFFLVVAEELHFRKAAERCYIAQPALSQHIRRLEQSLGVELFERGGRVVSLTPAGRALQEDARRILTECDHAIERAARAGRGEHGTLVVGYTPLTAYGALRTLLDSIRTTVPDVRTELRPARDPVAVTRLSTGELDVALTAAPLGGRDLEHRTYFREPLVFAGSAGGPLLHVTEPARIGELDGAPLVLLDRNRFPLTGELLDTCRAAGIAPHVVAEVSDVDALALSVAAQHATTVVPASLARLWKAIDVAVRPFADDDVAHRELRLRVQLTWSATSRNPALGRVLDTLGLSVSTNGRAMEALTR
jgi:DNA-binding transcriptional LysR family regulator